jgi:hypothetical protein
MICQKRELSPERKLLESAITTLVCALAHDEACQCGAAADELEELRAYWVDDAFAIVEEAERLGFWGDGDYDNE